MVLTENIRQLLKIYANNKKGEYKMKWLLKLFQNKKGSFFVQIKVQNQLQIS